MKKLFLSLITISMVVLSTSNLTYAAVNNDAVVTTLTNISVINKIELHGNVELYVSDGTADQVKVYNQYYAESALVQSSNGVLRISSYKNEKLVVWVTANDLRSIAAFDNSEVKSFGDLSKIELNVELHNNASAKLNFDVFSANVVLTDNSTAVLTGTVNELNLSRNFNATLASKNLSVAHFNENKADFATADNMAGI